MSTQRKIIVRLDADSRKSLNQGGFSLQLFKGAKADGNTEIRSMPIGVMRPNDIGLKNSFTWNDSYAGYTSPIIRNQEHTTIKSVTAVNMRLGDKYVLDSKGNAEVVSGEGKANKLMIVNQSTSRGAGYCIGMGDSASSTTPVCVVDTAGESEVLISPKNSYLLTFTSNTNVNPDVAIIKIDTSACTAHYENDTVLREVWFNYRTGRWDVTEEAAARKVESSDGLESNSWFRYVRMGAGVLNRVLNG